MTRVLEYCNLFFAAFFAVELVLKLIGLGLYGYFSDPFNTFDAIIVLIRFVTFDSHTDILSNHFKGASKVRIIEKL